MFNKKIVGLGIIALFSVVTTNAAYQEVSCSSDPLFEQYSCNQCFNGGEQTVGSNIGFLNDKWVNNNDNKQILYKAEQNMPSMKSINETTWKQIPDSENFWKYTSELDKYYSDEDAGYILPAKKSVSWLESSEGYAYNLESTNAKKGDPVGLLVYSLAVHNIQGEDNIQVKTIKHNECVLFTSATQKDTVPTTIKKPKKLPQTGPQEILLLILAMILAFGVVKFTHKRS